MLFILFLRRDKVDEHVAEFCNTFGINEDQHKAKITEYINFFLDVKEQLFTQYTQSPSACLQ
jgi:hypothetical protein